MIRLAVRIALAAALAVALALAGSSMWRRLVMMRQVGLPGWSPESGRRCDDPAGTPWRHCYGLAAAAGGVHAEDRVSFNRRTGRITQIARSWRVSDSAEMRRQEDSVVHALDGHEGARIDCALPTSTESGLQRVAAWRFQEQDVRMLRSRWRSSDAQQPTWMIQVSGFPVGYSGCQAWVRTRRLLTPMELLAGLYQWLVERTD